MATPTRARRCLVCEGDPADLEAEPVKDECVRETAWKGWTFGCRVLFRRTPEVELVSRREETAPAHIEERHVAILAREEGFRAPISVPFRYRYAANSPKGAARETLKTSTPMGIAYEPPFGLDHAITGTSEATACHRTLATVVDPQITKRSYAPGNPSEDENQSPADRNPVPGPGASANRRPPLTPSNSGAISPAKVSLRSKRAENSSRGVRGFTATTRATVPFGPESWKASVTKGRSEGSSRHVASAAARPCHSMSRS